MEVWKGVSVEWWKGGRVEGWKGGRLEGLARACNAWQSARCCMHPHDLPGLSSGTGPGQYRVGVVVCLGRPCNWQCVACLPMNHKALQVAQGFAGAWGGVAFLEKLLHLPSVPFQVGRHCKPCKLCKLCNALAVAMPCNVFL